QSSAANQVLVITNVLASGRFVTVLATCTVTAPHVSEATGSSNVQASGAETVRCGLQVIVGGVVSRTVMVCRQLALLPQASVAVQVRAMTLVPLQELLITSLYVMTTWLQRLWPVATPVALMLVSAGHWSATFGGHW